MAGMDVTAAKDRIATEGKSLGSLKTKARPPTGLPSETESSRCNHSLTEVVRMPIFASPKR